VQGRVGCFVLGGSWRVSDELALRNPDRGEVRFTIGDDRVVDVGEDHIVRRRYHISGGSAPRRDRYEYRHRQYENFLGRQWRRQHDELRRGGRKKGNRQWGRGDRTKNGDDECQNWELGVQL